MGVLSRFQPVILSILRITAAYMFMLHGTAKLFALPHIERFDNLQLMSLSGIAGVFEAFGGLLLLLGLFTRPVAFVLSGLMASAYFIAHASAAPLLPLINDGELAALYCFVFLYLASAGGGAWALDNAFKKAA
ncbi:LuxR family transcriptional regulator [Neisseria dentiae]|uniref:LuxR family transcriptional regulator n=1 Tax=Neisseria dentiae TaxID=194197 RepID=A0A1X3DFI8_9NEIS|nr:DoxX family protein [Neisseria dentiae]OSI18464.1 LuxR family transcriptional regulator [Neisseria dentiae]QMT45650.1 DoxX family protein [Neisseria dentiae]STZ51573.1 DoxX family protein [Neisseria dentiae]